MKSATDGTIKMAIDYVRDILVKSLRLEEEQVIIYNQRNWKLPTYEGAFFVLRYDGSPVIMSNRIKQVPDGITGLKDVQDINAQELITVSICSRNMEALQKKEMVLFALGGTYSQQIQELNSFQIARISPIEDVSSVEASAMLNRFDIPIRVNAWYQVEKTIDFYDTFNVEVDDEGTIREFDLSTSPSQ